MKKLILFVLLITAFSCGSSKKVITKKRQTTTTKTKTPVISKPRTTPTPAPRTETTTTTSTPSKNSNPVEAYIEDFSGIAMDEMKNYGVPASITLAQGILESGSGKGRLSVEANNHFGIKCHGWNGDKIYHDDDASQECFRKYNDAKYSFRDHSLFLKDRKRYYKLFQLDQDDYEGWAKELRAAGYATDKKYPEKLISLIERYDLSKYDKMVLGNSYKSNPRPTNIDNKTMDTHIVSKGDTLYSLSKKYNTTVELLKEMNKLTSNELKIGQTLIVKL
jgi:flagellum-specific peptidoglycan hydrolase FlgJ